MISGVQVKSCFRTEHDVLRRLARSDIVSSPGFACRTECFTAPNDQLGLRKHLPTLGSRHVRMRGSQLLADQ